MSDLLNEMNFVASPLYNNFQRLLLTGLVRNVPFNTLQVISETIFLTNHLTGAKTQFVPNQTATQNTEQRLQIKKTTRTQKQN